MAAPRREIAGWVLDRRLGKGGFGEVWEAHRPEAKLPVALKLVAVADDRAYEAWLSEIRLLNRLRHEHIVFFQDADLVRDDPAYPNHAYIATELCDGSLAAEIRGGSPLRQHDMLALVQGILAALTAAHEAQCVHRDVKPSNILRVGGKWKLCDFGIAELVPQQPTTTTPAVAGSLPYMSRAARLGRRGRAADLYAFGVTLHQALSGLLLDPIEPQVSPELSEPWSNVVSALIGAEGREEPNPARAIGNWFSETGGRTGYDQRPGGRQAPPKPGPRSSAIANRVGTVTAPTEREVGEGGASFWSTAPAALVIGVVVVLVLFAIVNLAR